VYLFLNFFLEHFYYDCNNAAQPSLLLVSPHHNNGTAHPSYISYCSKRKCFIASYVQLILQQYKSAIKVAPIKIAANFCYKWKPLRATTKSTLFTVCKNERGTKECPSKSMKNASCVVIWQRNLSS